MKTCTKCGKEKPFDCFGKYAKDGREYYRSKCKPCLAEYTRELNLSKRMKVPCAICGKLFMKTKTTRNKRFCKDCLPRHRAEYARRDYVLLASKQRDRRRSSTMTDSYITKCLLARGFTKEQITPELITAHRALIKLKRAIKETV